MFIVDLFFSALYWLINPHWVFKLIWQKIGVEKNSLSQQEANNFLIKPEHRLTAKYTFLLIVFAQAYMYSDLVPLGLCLAPISLFVFYWNDKLNLSKRSSFCPIGLSTSYLYSFMDMLEYIIVLKPVVNATVLGIATQEFNLAEFFMFGIGIAYIFAPK